MSSGHNSGNNIFEGFFDFFQKQKTFRPRKKFDTGTLRYSLYTNAQASLNSGINLKEAVKLPQGENLNEWVAVHVVDFFNRINLIYGTVCDYCTEKSCQKMSGGPKFEYLWQDGQIYKKPTALSAPKYIALLMDWIESQINDEKIFPTSTVGEFHLVPAKELEPLVVMTERLMAPNSTSENAHQNQQIVFEDCSATTNTMSTLLAKNFPNPEINSEFENISIGPFSSITSTSDNSRGARNETQVVNIKVTFEEDK